MATPMPGLSYATSTTRSIFTGFFFFFFAASAGAIMAPASRPRDKATAMAFFIGSSLVGGRCAKGSAGTPRFLPTEMARKPSLLRSDLFVGEDLYAVPLETSGGDPVAFDGCTGERSVVDAASATGGAPGFEHGRRGPRVLCRGQGELGPPDVLGRHVDAVLRHDASLSVEDVVTI